MTVKEIIQELEQIENKELVIYVEDIENKYCQLRPLVIKKSDKYNEVKIISEFC